MQKSLVSAGKTQYDRVESGEFLYLIPRQGTAGIESFFATFKKEELYHKEYHTYEELKNGIDEYILFYNQIRPHKKLKYVSPCEFEVAYYNNLQS